MVGFEVEILASVDGFTVNFGGQWPFPDDRNFQKSYRMV
jgi:hypothetical protein